MRNDKKFIVKVVAGRSRFDTLQMMHTLAGLLYNSHDISIMGMNPAKCEFETPNCVVRYISNPNHLDGLRPDEIFGCSLLVRNCYRKPSNTEPYDGGILNYILEVEKAAAEEEKVEVKEHEQSREIDILEFLEWVIGSELTDIQRDMVKTFKRLHDDNCKVVYGRGGKIHVVPVEDKED